MGIRTLKIDTPVLIKGTDKKGVISSIDKGRYKLSGSGLFYSSNDLVAEKTKKQLKKNTPINRESPQQTLLNKIYAILSKEYKQHNKTCIANFPGCTRKATQIHHRYKRTGFWLIITNYFLPICRTCHRHATIHSKEAIEQGVSVSRHTELPYSFTGRERELMKQFGVNPP